MDRKKMLSALIPAGGAAAVVILIGILIAMSDWGGSSAGKPPSAKTEENDLSKFPHFSLTGPEWKSIDEANYPGLKSWDVTVGNGTPTPAGATVTIHYTGWTLDGNKFDSSYGKGPPATFPLGSLVKGWQVGIPGMMPGGKRRLLIPQQFAYGESGRPPSIPPRATLVFEIEML